jgi:hypothetical protein
MEKVKRRITLETKTEPWGGNVEHHWEAHVVDENGEKENIAYSTFSFEDAVAQALTWMLHEMDRRRG